MSDDLPTLLLPIKAYSDLSGLGHKSNDGEEMIYFAERICMMQNNGIQNYKENERVVVR
jgi:hypothetical protein